MRIIVCLASGGHPFGLAAFPVLRLLARSRFGGLSSNISSRSKLFLEGLLCPLSPLDSDDTAFALQSRQHDRRKALNAPKGMVDTKKPRRARL
jgi:hypothetical protein